MKKVLTAGIMTAVAWSAASQTITLNGAGASFPAPVYRVWTYNYKQATGVKVNYQSVGSGAGISQIKAGTIDFGASDKPLEKKELDQAGLMQFPMLMGGVVVVANLPGVQADELKLDGPTLAGIFLGKIKKWDDPAILRLNIGVQIPSIPITVVHRSDGSGTTWIFTNYLNKVSPEWKRRVGNGKAVKWPVGIGGQKNPGVGNNVKRIKGAVGYIEYTYAVEAQLPALQLKNKAGKFVRPALKSFQAAGANADWKNAPGYYLVLTDQPGSDSWPITGVTYILIYRQQPDMVKAKALLDYFGWCYKQGAAAAAKLQYVPLPGKVAAMVENSWAEQLTAGGEAVKR
ncbi:MAG: phosphate ABC transporter substrate-binding protein PstS [Victivallaceae bacterium]|nr:phosphate ABC transporter substrate-binding protein PstS [Victivallaceae bacterium]